MRKISITCATSENCKEIAMCGFTACDYQGFLDIHGDFFKFDLSERLSHLKEFAGTAAKCGIEIYQAHGPWVWPTGNDTQEGRKAWFNYMIIALESCVALNCKNLVVHPIMPFGHTSRPDEKAYFAINRDFWEKLLPHAQRCGVSLCLENMPFTEQSLASTKSICDFVNSFESEYFNVCYDTGHSLVFNEDFSKSINLIGKKLKAFHIHDNDRKQDRHLCPLFGSGNWWDFSDALKNVDENLPLSLECSVPQNLTDDLKKQYLSFLANTAHSLMV